MGYKEFETQNEYYETLKDKNRSVDREKGGTKGFKNNEDLTVKLGNIGKRDWMEEENVQNCDRNEAILKCEKIKDKEVEKEREAEKLSDIEEIERKHFTIADT